MFKVENNNATELMKELFTCKISPYDLHKYISFQRSKINSVSHKTDSVSYLGLKIFDLEPTQIKEIESFNSFEFKIKRSVPEGCPFRIYKIYIRLVGFIVT